MSKSSEGFHYTVTADDQTQGALRSAMNGAKRVAAGITSIFTAPIKIMANMNTFAFVQNGKMLLGMIERFADLNAEADKTTARLKASLQGTGMAAGRTQQQIEAMAGSLQSKGVFDDESFIDAAGVLTRFRSLRGPLFDQALKLSGDLAAAMGSGEVKGAARMLGRALEDPSRGMMQLRRAGVMLSYSQQQAIKTMMETNNVAGAQSLLMKSVAAMIGKANAELAKTPSGAVRQMKNAISDVGEAIGAILGPSIIAISRKIKGVAESIKAYLVDNMESMTQLISGSLIVAGQALSGGFKKLVALFGDTLSGGGERSGKSLVDGFMGFVGDLPLLVTKITLTIEKAFFKMVAVISNLAASLIDSLSSPVSSFLTGLSSKFGKVGREMAVLLGAMMSSPSMTQPLKDLGKSAEEQLKGMGAEFAKLDDQMKKNAETAKNMDKNAKLQAWTAKVKDLKDQFKAVWGSWFGQASAMAKPVMKAFEEMKAGSKSVADKLKDAMTAANDKVKSTAEAYKREFEKLLQVLDKLKAAELAQRMNGADREMRQFEIRMNRTENPMDQRRLKLQAATELSDRVKSENDPEMRAKQLEQAQRYITELQNDKSVWQNRRDREMTDDLANRIEDAIAFEKGYTTFKAKKSVTDQQAIVNQAQRDQEAARREQIRATAAMRFNEFKEQMRPLGVVATETANMMGNFKKAVIDSTAVLGKLAAHQMGRPGANRQTDSQSAGRWMSGLLNSLIN